MRINPTTLIRGAMFLALASLTACGGEGDGQGSTTPTTTYTIGGSVSGLSGTVVLQNNGGNNLSISANGAFTFGTRLASGATYSISVVSNPAGQICSVNPYSGTVSAANVTSVAVTCAAVLNTYTIGGSVSGLTGSGLVLRNNGGDDLPVAAGVSAFTFNTALASGATYTVSVKTHPTGQTCSVSAASGTVASSNVTNVAVICATATTTPTTYTIGGNVTGLTGTELLVLQDNKGDDLSITSDGNFAFATKHANNYVYVVTVLLNPTGKTCSVSSGVGLVSGMDVTSVRVTCSPISYTVSGEVSGLTGTELVLQNNGGDNLSISADGAFIFATALTSGAAYNVTVQNQPLAQTCTVTSGSGTVSSANVTGVLVTCSAATYTIGGTVSGLTGTGLVLQNNGGDNLPVSGNYTFGTALPNNTPYNVTILSQPTGPAQICTVANASGTVSANVTNANVTCVNAYTISGMIYGAADGVGPILQNNGGDNLYIPAITTTGTPFSFTTPIANGDTYSITQLARARAPAQDCKTGTLISGTVSGAEVTNVTITCAISTIVPSFAYVTNGNSDSAWGAPDTVSAFTIGAAGSLTATSPPTTATGDQPYAVAVEPTGRFAYVVNDTDSVSAYGIDPVTGVLTLIDADGATSGTQGSIATGDSPKSIAIHPSGKFAYVLNQGNGNTTGKTLSAYSIDETSGALTPIDADGATGTQLTIATGAFPYEVAVDPLGRFAYVANNGDDTVSAYKIDQTTGALTVAGTVAAGNGPSSIAIDPTGRCALVANNSSNDVYSYAVNADTGALTPVTATTPVAASAPRSVAVDPNAGLYAYVANAGGSVSAFRITLSTCAITEINADAGGTGPTIPAGTLPLAINVDPSGQFVYVANFGSFDLGTRTVTEAGNVSVYSINALTGALTPVAGSPFSAGSNPTSVTTTE